LDDDRFPLNIEQIAMELTSLTPEEIRYYPLTDLTPEEIELVLEHLTPNNLAKVLLNIPQESLLEIQDILSPLTIDKTLDRISEPNRTQIENRFLVSSPP
jgi:Mg/Co/Ni transporter MgtE